MTVRKLSVALDQSVADAAVDAAAREGLSLSAWLSRAAERALTIERGLEAVRAWEREKGALTDAELADADVVLNRVLGRRVRRVGR
ncbi:MAG TPA: hypothetical protein VEP49_02820 [Acidimicrobiia bacterium]|nr:hypothetical protein [Acidimicrobiia bacterium]